MRGPDADCITVIRLNEPDGRQWRKYSINKKEQKGEMNMKIGIIAIGVMVLIASTAVVMAQNDHTGRLWIEGNKIMFLQLSEGNLTYKVELTGPVGSDITTVYEGGIGRDVGTGKAKLYTVLFSEKDNPTNPTGEAYNEYDSDDIDGVDTQFVLGDIFDAEIWVNDSTGNVKHEIGVIEIIEEE